MVTVHYIVPVVVRREGTISSAAIIPVLLSIYLLYKNKFWVRGLIGTAIIAAIRNMLATPVAGSASQCRCSLRRW